jgi:hypothetical protein
MKPDGSTTPGPSIRPLTLSPLGEREARAGAFTSRRGTGEGVRRSICVIASTAHLVSNGEIPVSPNVKAH